MRKSHLLILLFSLLIVNCSKKDKSNTQENIEFDTNKPKAEYFTFNVDTFSNQATSKPLLPEALAKIFPPKILDFNIDKVNKGTINYSGNTINSASAEYISNNGLMVVYVYDYKSFANLPYYLRNMFELTTKDEIINIPNGVVRFSTDNLSTRESLECIYNYRFHIKIEAVNFPNFREAALDILNHLDLTKLLEKERTK